MLLINSKYLTSRECQTTFTWQLYLRSKKCILKSIRYFLLNIFQITDPKMPFYPKWVNYPSGVNISHKNWNFSGTASENFNTFPFPHTRQESRWAGKHHVQHDAFRSTATCMGSSSSLFFSNLLKLMFSTIWKWITDFSCLQVLLWNKFHNPARTAFAFLRIQAS